MKSGKYEVLRDRWFCSRKTFIRLMLTRDSRNGVVECWEFRGRRYWDPVLMVPGCGRARLANYVFGGRGCAESEAYPAKWFEAECGTLRINHGAFVESTDDPNVYPFRSLKRAYLDWLSWRDWLVVHGRRDALKLQFSCSMMPGAGNIRSWGWYGCCRSQIVSVFPAERGYFEPDFDFRFRTEVGPGCEGVFECRKEVGNGAR